MRRGRSRDYVLTEEQRASLTAACQGPIDLVIVGAMLVLGLRISELTHMRGSWLKDQYLTIPHKMPCDCGDHPVKAQWSPKTTLGARTLYVPPHLLQVMQAFFKDNPQGIGMRRTACYLHFKGIAKRARIYHKGLRDNTVFPHVLRATCATVLAERGMEAAHLAYIMGWSSIEIAAHYVDTAKARRGALRKASEIYTAE